jgi:GTP cyclohydrolase II
MAETLELLRQRLMSDPVVVIGSGPDSVSLLGPVTLPRRVDGVDVTLRWYPFASTRELEACRTRDAAASASPTVDSFLVYGEIERARSPLVRLHSCCATGEVFRSSRCECGPQLDAALSEFVRAGCGALVYFAGQEGRGIGLWNKAMTYLLQEHGLDTFEANEALGFPDDPRDYAAAAAVLRYFLMPHAGVRLLTNNPAKKKAMQRAGIRVDEMRPLVVGLSVHNLAYVQAKQCRGHAYKPRQACGD